MLDCRQAAFGRHQPGRRRTAAAAAGAGSDRGHPTCQPAGHARGPRTNRPARHLAMAAQPVGPQAAQARGGGFGQQDGPHRVGHDGARGGLPAPAGCCLTLVCRGCRAHREKMLIGRTDDPHNPCRVAASKVTVPFGSGIAEPIWASGKCRDKQAGHTTATAPHRILFPHPLHQPGRPHTPYGAASGA
jgi:hypothetical protein